MKKRIIIASTIGFILVICLILFFVPKPISKRSVQKKLNKIVNNYFRKELKTIDNFPDFSFIFDFEELTMQNGILTTSSKGTWYVTKKGKDNTLFLEIKSKWEIGNVGNNELTYYIKDDEYLIIENNQKEVSDEMRWKTEVMTYFIFLLAPSKNENCLLDVNLLQTNLISATQQGFKTKLSARTNDITIDATYNLGRNYFKTLRSSYTRYENYQITSITNRNYIFNY